MDTGVYQRLLRGLLALITHSCFRLLEAATGGSRVRDALNGHEESAGILIDGSARVVVGDVPHEALGTLEAPAGALAAPLRAIVKGREGRGRRWHDGGCNSRLHSSHARTCENVTVHNLN